MALFKYDEATVAAEKQKLIDEVAPHCNGEQVLAVGPFRHGGAAAKEIIGRGHVGALAYSGVSLAMKKRAGGLPGRVLLAVTPTKLYAFSWKMRGRSYKVKKEAAVWDRDQITCTTSRKGTMTTLTIESPSEGEKATLVGGSIQDDPWSQEVMQALVATGEQPA
jgi:hypothetical protein